MLYDEKNDRLISLDGEVQIYPHGETFAGAITLEIGSGLQGFDFDVSRIDDLIDGLQKAKAMTANVQINQPATRVESEKK